MSGVYRYAILKDSKLVLHYHQGEVTLDGLKDLKKRVIADPEFDFRFQSITDLQRAYVKLNFDEVFELLNFYKGIYEGCPLTRHALVNDQPMSTALSLLFAKENRNPSKDYHVCSSYESAVMWLGCEEELDAVKTAYRALYEPLNLG